MLLDLSGMMLELLDAILNRKALFLRRRERIPVNGYTLDFGRLQFR